MNCLNMQLKSEVHQSIYHNDTTEQVRANDRALRKTSREVDRERNDLERMEKKLVGFNLFNIYFKIN